MYLSPENRTGVPVCIDNRGRAGYGSSKDNPHVTYVISLGAATPTCLIYSQYRAARHGRFWCSSLHVKQFEPIYLAIRRSTFRMIYI